MCRVNGASVRSASGKSTFINTQLSKYISGFRGYKVTNSDIQVEAFQYKMANFHYLWLLKNVDSQKDLDAFIKDTAYMSNRGKLISIPITWDWWEDNMDNGIKAFYNKFKKLYYATYFDIRDFAKEAEKTLFATKIVSAGNLLVIDTVGGRAKKIFDRLKQAKKEGFHNTIVYLEIDPELCVERDIFREKHFGRGVGRNVIYGYASIMDTAHKEYIQNGKLPTGVVDRLLHFIWKPSGDSPIKGTWNKINDDRFSLKRNLKK